MENATKALLIVAGVLIGVLILSLAVYLYYSLSEYVEETQQEIQLNAINKFNNQFLQYNNTIINNAGMELIDFKITVQDIVTVANIAYENNKKYNLTEADADNPNKLYVKVSATLYKPDNTSKIYSNLEKDINGIATEILSTYTAPSTVHNYRCGSSDIKISQETGRVYSINFR